jgi:guanylate kinase
MNGMEEMMENNRIKVLALFGKSSVGKNTILNSLMKNYDLNRIIACTTRPRRDNEIDGVDYHFLDIKDFTSQMVAGELLEASEFNNWFYGTQFSELRKDKVNVGIFNTKTIREIINNPNLHVLSVQIVCEDKERLQRSLKREQNPDCREICRRYLSDEEDFANIDFPYTLVDNSTNNIFCSIEQNQTIKNFIKGIDK